MTREPPPDPRVMRRRPPAKGDSDRPALGATVGERLTEAQRAALERLARPDEERIEEE